MSVIKIQGYALCMACCLFLVYCGNDAGEMNPQNKDESIANSNILYTLDINHTSITQSIGPEPLRPEKYKFLEIEIGGVRNPKKYPVIFEVHYRTEDGGKILLGTFSLYPPDNPGTFIVPTQGKLRGEGEIILSLLIPEKVAADDILQVTVKKIRLREQ
jgi:hypothetical protein